MGSHYIHLNNSNGNSCWRDAQAMAVAGAYGKPVSSIPDPTAAAKGVLSSGPQTILAYGALLSERSARLTFPYLQNFRLARVSHLPVPAELQLARVSGLRRVFAHPHLFLISQEVLDPSKTLRIASLSAEMCDHPGSGFVVGMATCIA
eukprot:CAMPEP_0117685374 /NCGR_PEP_ID=MMETSP0804-20121206/21698_1 /TAXON_ID=1074897 /ORGANISM="Tetraselmis astigmatica, Strain CCMP880" /LENGTH=147 /DNA_ID=CAMNT_0005496627 /DNA_START=574 /DNA_END=1018 /DNA_ORIENTATION=-